MTDDIKVSISMPVYNHEKYVVQAIESVLMQRVNFKYELLIGEDCSTDNSLELIKRYENVEQVKIFAREKNMNNEKITNSLDLKLRSKGKYSITLEGDDYWIDRDKLQKQVDFLDANPAYIACGHKFQVVDKDGHVYHDEAFESQFFQDNPYDKSIFEKGLMLSHINSLMFRNIYKEGCDLSLFSDYVPLGGDYILTGYLVLHGKMYCLPEVMSSYRKVINKESSSYSAQMEVNNQRDVLYKKVCALEKHLKKKYQISLEGRKKSAYASAVFKWNRERTRANFNVIKNIIKFSGNPLKYIWWLIYLLVARFLKNLIGKTNEKVAF